MRSVAESLVSVRYFAAASDAAGRDAEVIPFDSGPSVGDVRSLLITRYGSAMARVLAAGSFLVDGVVSRDPEAPVGSRVDVLPPFAGG